VNILDTDALSHHMKKNSIGAAIEHHLIASPDPEFRITAISAFEMVDGALAMHRSLKQRRKGLIPAFTLIQETIEYLASWRGRICAYDDASERIYMSLAPRLRQEIGDDARIAAIALALDAAVWTCNVDDYKRVPGLVVYRAETGLRVT
jgi:predicted nucleic acid-binding protein